jgi:hypothetical protein
MKSSDSWLSNSIFGYVCTIFCILWHFRFVFDGNWVTKKIFAQVGFEMSLSYTQDYFGVCLFYNLLVMNVNPCSCFASFELPSRFEEVKCVLRGIVQLYLCAFLIIRPSILILSLLQNWCNMVLFMVSFPTHF